MRRHRIDLLVTKNSGGPLTEGKLTAARDLGLPVVMVRRPLRPGASSCSCAAEAADWVRRATRGPS
jgi:precorrin-6A/cobalt-precorrin-6A reductase